VISEPLPLGKAIGSLLPLRSRRRFAGLLRELSGCLTAAHLQRSSTEATPAVDVQTYQGSTAGGAAVILERALELCGSHWRDNAPASQ
jgi:hypothetical protein